MYAEESNVIEFKSTVSLPPQSVDNEIALLSAILAAPDAISRISGLNPEMFYVPIHQVIFRLMLSLFQKGYPCDRGFILSEASGIPECQLLERELLKLADGEGILYQEGIEKRSEVIAGKWRSRKLQEIAAQAQKKSATDDDNVVADWLISEVLNLREKPASMVSWDEASTEARGWLELQNAGVNSVELGIKTGYYDVDSIISCLPFGKLSGIGGRAGMGKSTFALDIAVSAASQGAGVLFYAYEMAASDLAKKAIAAKANVPASLLFRMNALNDRDWGQINDAIATMDLNLHIDDSPYTTPLEIRSQIIRGNAKGENIRLVVIDYLQIMPRPGNLPKNAGQTESIRENLQVLRAIAKEFNIAVLLTGQIKREVDARNDKRPTMGDWEWCSGAEQELALMINLYRDEYYHKETIDRGIIELIISKNRFGSTGTIKLLFDPIVGVFKNMVR